jgi:hypothetical protein
MAPALYCIMTDSAESVPCLAVPRRLEGATLSKFADAVVAACPDGWPPLLMIDFEKSTFIEPAGSSF